VPTACPERSRESVRRVEEGRIDSARVPRGRHNDVRGVSGLVASSEVMPCPGHWDFFLRSPTHEEVGFLMLRPRRDNRADALGRVHHATVGWLHGGVRGAEHFNLQDTSRSGNKKSKSPLNQHEVERGTLGCIDYSECLSGPPGPLTNQAQLAMHSRHEGRTLRNGADD